MDRFPPIYRLATGIFRRIVFPLKGGLRAVGVEKVPIEGGLIIAPVHVSQLDPPALAVALKRRRLRAMAKEELWNNKLYGKIIEGIGAFPVKRGAGDTESVRKCISLLQAGEAVIVFPEGSRNDRISMRPLLSGVAMLAKKAGVPVVPAGIGGTGVKSSRRGVTVVFGDPIRYEDVARGGSEKETRQIFLDQLASEIMKLCIEAGIALKSAQSRQNSSECSDPAPQTAEPGSA